jgi:Arc/MetJ-type ribon-helix-helix transcriptional regulator
MQKSANVTKWTVSIPPDLAQFVERYQQTHDLESRSEVIAQGLRTLQAAELEQAYRDHAKEWQNDPERAFWDAAATDDGLEER